jgi:hypothetical protein
MKKSAKVTLTLAAAIGLASCNRGRRDPCEAGTFDQAACEAAVRDGGYHWHGAWVPMAYGHPYPFYFDAYRNHVNRGGSVMAAPAGSYSRPSAGGVSRGGFGSIGSGRVSGG